MEAALRPEDAAELNLVREFEHAVGLEHVIDGEVRRTLVTIGTVQEGASRLHERAVGARELAVGVRATR
ncbi:hypothetical protein D3C83_133770 [compost metagenome]